MAEYDPLGIESKEYDPLGIESESSFLSNVGRSAKRAAGVALGAVNAPLAAVWGALAPPWDTEQAKEEYFESSIPKQFAIRTGAALESAKESITKEGSFGKGYGEYYEGVTGKKASPWAELAVNIASDPLIVGGVAKGLGRGGFETLKQLKDYFKTGRSPMPVESIEAFERAGGKSAIPRLEDTTQVDKQAEAQKIIDALKKRKADAEWYEKWGTKQLDEVEKAAIAERERGQLGSLADDVIPPGDRPPMSALDQALNQPEKIMATGAGDVDTALRISTDELDAFRAAQMAEAGELKPVSARMGGTPLVETPSAMAPARMAVSERQGAAQVGADTAFPARRYDEPFGAGVRMRAGAGGALGFEEDENGDFTYNAAKGLMGFAGGVTLTKLFKGSGLQKEIAKEPEVAKVFGAIVKDKPSYNIAGIVPKINEFIFNRFSPVKDVSYKTYEQALVYSSHKDVSWMKFQELQDVLKPVKNAEDLMTGYVAAKRMAVRGARGIDNPNGITGSEAKKAVARIEALYANRGGKVEDMRAAADGFNEWTNKYILQEARDSGLLSKEAYDKILKENDFYATFKILEKLPEDINKVVPTTGEYFSVGQQGVIKTMKGTERQMADPITATIEKFTQAQATFARNKVASTFIDDPATKGMTRPVATSGKQFAILKNQGLDPVMEGSWSVRDFDTINRFKDGRVEKYLVPKDITEALKRITPFQAPKFIQAVNNLFRKSATTLYLPFTFSNAMRDAFMAYNTSPVYAGGKEALTSLGKFGKDWAGGLKEGFLHEFLGKSDLVKDYLKAGGGFGYSGEVRSSELAKKALFQSKVDVVKDQVSLFKIIEKISGTVELAPRIGVYKRAIKDYGASDIEAAKLARSSTIDFSKGGVLTKSLNQFVPFINARVQGWNNVRLALQKNPKETTTKLFASVVIPGVSAYAYNRHYYSDLYDDIPRYIRDNYFTFITGTDKDKNGKTIPQYFVIPKGDVGQLVMNPIEYALDQANSKDRDGLAKFSLNWVSDLSPVPIAREGELSGTKTLGSITPPLVKGVVEDIFNKNMFTGRDVVPFNLKDKPADLQFKDNTPETYKWLGAKTNISPLRIQNFMQNIFAGYGREGLDPASMVKGLTGRFVKTQGGEKESQTWEIVREIDSGYKNVRARAQSLIKSGKEDEAMEIMGAWNDGLVSNISKIEKFGFEDQGGLYRQYIFSRNKMRNVLSGKELEKGIENKLSRRKTYTYKPG